MRWWPWARPCAWRWRPAVRVILVEPGAVRSEFRQTLAKAMGDLPERIRGTAFEPLVAGYVERHRAHADTHGLPAPACAERIAAAMARKRPPRRVVIGRDARLGNLAKAILPRLPLGMGPREGLRAILRGGRRAVAARFQTDLDAMPEKRLYLIDTFALIFRAYYGNMRHARTAPR